MFVHTRGKRCFSYSGCKHTVLGYVKAVGLSFSFLMYTDFSAHSTAEHPIRCYLILITNGASHIIDTETVN